MAKIKGIEDRFIKNLKPYEKNAKLHSKEQIEKIADSIKAFGFLNPCLVDKEGNIIAGHGRIEAAKLLGMETVPCVDVDGLTEEQRRAYILADNKLTELGGWDEELVSQELETLKECGFDISLTGFDIDDILITDDMAAEEEPEETEEEIKATTPRIKQGEVWQLGKHRLMCGDSTNIENVIKLTGGGYCKAPAYRPAIQC